MKCGLRTAYRPTKYSIEYSLNGVIHIDTTIEKHEIDAIIDELDWQFNDSNFRIIRRWETKGQPYTVVL